MSMTKWTVASVVTLFACATLAFAAEPTSQPSGPGPQTVRPGGDGRDSHPLIDALKDMKLTPDQREKVEKILQAHRKAMEDFRTKNGSEIQSLMQQIQQARENKDRDAARAAEQKLKPILQQREALMQDAMTQLKGVLT